MFCFAKSTSKDFSTSAVLLDYYDPNDDPTPFAPPMVRLKASMNSFRNLGVVPEMKLVHTVAEINVSRLAVLDGGIKFEGDKFLFQNKTESYELDLTNARRLTMCWQLESNSLESLLSIPTCNHLGLPLQSHGAAIPLVTCSTPKISRWIGWEV